jgi:ribonuclease P protein component
MLPKINRIKKKKDFDTIFKTARREPSFKGSFFVFRAVKNNLGINRFGFVVSQKVSKRATVRNKVRRRLTAAIKDEAKNIKPGIDLVLIAQPGIEKQEFLEIRAAVKKNLVKSGISTENKNV